MLAPKLLWAFQQVWLTLGIVALLVFAWRMTEFTAHLYGALPAALMFLLMEVIMIYTILFATENGLSGGSRY